MTTSKPSAPVATIVPESVPMISKTQACARCLAQIRPGDDVVKGGRFTYCKGCKP